MDCFPFPTKSTCLAELQRDPLFPKIPADSYGQIIEDAWNRGAEAASRCFGQTPISIAAALEKAGLQITRIARDQVLGGMRYFAEFYEKSKNVFLYTTSVQLWSEHNGLCYASGEELILAHEFFHYLECKSLCPAKDVFTVARFQIGRWRFGSSSLRAVSEIGAHSFAYAYYTHRVNSLVCS